MTKISGILQARMGHRRWLHMKMIFEFFQIQKRMSKMVRAQEKTTKKGLSV